MARDIVCPHCGTIVPIDELHAHDGPIAHLATSEIVIPATVSDGDFEAMTAGEGFLPPSGSGSQVEIVPPPPPGLAPARPAYGSSAEVHAITLSSSSASDEFEARRSSAGLLDFPAGPSRLPEGGEERVGPLARPGVAIPALGFEVDPRLRTFADPAGSRGDRSAEARVEGDRPRGTHWPTVLLGSYASAMTLAVAYLLWFAPKRDAPPEAMPMDRRLDLGDRPVRRGVAAPIPHDHRAALGRPLEVGDLELTPIEVEVGRARLRRINPDSEDEVSDGGAGSLVLRLRLRNLSETETFAPLDRGFIRQPDRGFSDSYVELEGGEVIENYRLAVESEMAIIGQSFEPLRPGARREVIIVSDQGAAPLAKAAEGPMTWRIRLRTGSDRDEMIGVRFSPEEVQ